MAKRKIDVIIISYNTRDYTLECIRSVKLTTNDFTTGIIVVDNASSDDTIEAIHTEFPDVEIVINKKNLGYAAAINRGAEASDAEYLILSNSDVVFHRNAIDLLVEYLESHPFAGTAGPQQYYPDGSWQYSFNRFPGAILAVKDILFISAIERKFHKLTNRFNIFKHPRRVDYTDGAVIAVRHSDFLEAGGFDESYFFYSEETDFCRKMIESGHKNSFIPKSKVTHHRGASTGASIPHEKNIRMQIQSQIHFCDKWLSPASAWFYITFDKYYYLILAWLLRLAYVFVGSDRRQNFRQKIMSLIKYFEIWKEAVKPDK